jgi:hypothetical protein
MAGLGTRFRSVHPAKALCPIPPRGEPMFVHAVKHLGFTYDRLILITLAQYNLKEIAADPIAALGAELIELPSVTRGAADTVLKARRLLEENKDSQLVVCNVDQAMVWPGDWAMDWFVSRGAEGGIPTLERKSKRHSYCMMDEKIPHKVNGVREKELVSNRATIGVYWFHKARGFLAAADRMFAAQDVAPNGEYYVGPIYNHLDGLILEYPLAEFWSLGEPENLRAYIEKDYAAAALD